MVNSYCLKGRLLFSSSKRSLTRLILIDHWYGQTCAYSSCCCALAKSSVTTMALRRNRASPWLQLWRGLKQQRGWQEGTKQNAYNNYWQKPTRCTQFILENLLNVFGKTKMWGTQRELKNEQNGRLCEECELLKWIHIRIFALNAIPSISFCITQLYCKLR